jgi:hypothetical protein
MSGEMVTFELPATHALVRHNSELERVVRKRNAEIAELKVRLDGEGESEQMQRARNDGYKRGWADAINGTTEAARVARNAIENLRSNAVNIYIKGPTEGGQS